MRGRIALFLHHPECSRTCCYGILNALRPHYDITIFSDNNFTPSTLNGYDIVAFPGGVGDSDKYYEFWKRKNANLVADFIEGGGRYLGICMGAYWAGEEYFDLLDNVKIEQYIKRPTANVRRSYVTANQIMWEGKPENMFFWDGPVFLGDNFETVATYANGEPMAIIQNRIGLIGSHPESMESWYNKPYLKPYWHAGEHHKLLLNFVDKLMSK